MGTGVDLHDPSAYGTGFNDRSVETMFRWLDPANSVTPAEVFEGFWRAVVWTTSWTAESGRYAGNLAEAEVVVPVVPEEIVPWIKAIQDTTWDAGPDTVLRRSGVARVTGMVQTTATATVDIAASAEAVYAVLTDISASARSARVPPGPVGR